MDDLFGISLEISVEQQPYPVLFTVTEEGCKAFAPDFPKIQIQAGTMETALMEAKKQIQKALSQFKYPPIPHPAGRHRGAGEQRADSPEDSLNKQKQPWPDGRGCCPLYCPLRFSTK